MATTPDHKHSDDWVGHERRALDPSIVLLQTHFDARIDEVIALIRDGFPEGDLRKHREVHEGYIEDAKARKVLKEAVIRQIVTGTAWATLIFLAAILWQAFKHEVTTK